MAKTENKGRCKSFDNQMIDFFCFPMISVLCTGSGYKETTDSSLSFSRFFVYSQ